MKGLALGLLLGMAVWPARLDAEIGQWTVWTSMTRHPPGNGLVKNVEIRGCFSAGSESDAWAKARRVARSYNGQYTVVTAVRLLAGCCPSQRPHGCVELTKGAQALE